MIELGVDGDLISWTKSFFTNRKVQCMINSHNNQEKKLKPGSLEDYQYCPYYFLSILVGYLNS